MDMDYRSMVNPTYLTAKSTVLMLAGAGNEDAKRIIGALEMQNELRQKTRESNGGQMPLSETDLKAVMAGTSAGVEARYAAVSRYLRTEGYTNLLDIACGYTPRSLYCAKSGIDYVGVDVPVVVEQLQRMAEKLGIQEEHPTYVAGDATNAASLKAAADMLEGRTLISCEGLTHYLSENEFKQFLGGVREILLDHGGAWVTSDMGIEFEDFAVACMSGADAADTYRSARKRTMKAGDIYGEGVAYWDADRKQALIESCGLRAEQVPIYHGDEDLISLRALPEAWREAIEKVLDSGRLWVMTVDESYQDSPAIKGAQHIEHLNVEYTKQSGVLRCQVDGRIDTISAPMFMEFFDANSEGITAMQVDATNLQYISSAGLRVLMLAVKKLGDGSVEVLNASDEVKEIFATTGFDEFIRVK